MRSRIDGVWALVPVKPFDAAKSRLAPALGPRARGALARAMLADVLEALMGARRLRGVLVVTADPEAAAVGAAHGACALNDPDEPGLDAAVAHGLGHLADWGASGAVVAHADLPRLTSAEVDRLVAGLADASVAMTPAARDGGTNLLAMTPPALMATAYGPDSFASHLSRARSLGVEPGVVRLEGAGQDIDAPVDLESLARFGAGRAADLLRRLAVAAAPTSRPEAYAS